MSRRIDASTPTTLRVNGQDLLSFAGTNLLGLAHHPKVLAAAQESLARCGLSAAASRSTSGNFAEHENLEEALAEFLGLEAALILPSGWLANEAVMEAYGDELETVLVDSDSHASIWTASTLANTQVIDCGAGDLTRAHALMDRNEDKHMALMTDGMFPMRRRIAPLADFLRLLPRKGMLIVDDSYGLGFLGKGGRGSLSGAGISDPRAVLTGSMAKALGAGGGFIASSTGTIERIRRRAEVFMGTTPISPAVAAGARAALQILEAEPERVRRLRAHAARLSPLAERLGLDPGDGRGPVLPLPVEEAKEGRRLEKQLAAEGLYIPWIEYGGGSGALRVAVSSEHTGKELERLEAVLLRVYEP
ncbi:MAG: pyridoxal phosphate-dependent aminotransferase family protein [Planctomycetota bacterium]|nr:pyridoxal phosphate-dependent aminotransferase family protein [Planctomycetota bacterium]